MGHQKRYASEPWYVAMRRAQREEEERLEAKKRKKAKTVAKED